MSVGIGDESLASRLEEVADVARQISLARNLGESIQTIANSARDLTGADSCVIYLQRPYRGGEEFEMAANSPLDQYPTRPRFPGGLTEKIVTENSSITISDTIHEDPFQGVKIKREIIEAGIRSIAGVPIMGTEQEPMGVIYVYSKMPSRFSTVAVRVLKTLANFAPLAQRLPGPLIKLTEEAETAAEKLFEVENTARNLCEAVQAEFGFDFVALQVIDRAEESISTIYGTGVAGEWTGLASHPLDRPGECDIQSDIATADPPRVETITGWDDRFDRWIFERFDHRTMSRVWAPIIVFTDENGDAITNWADPSVWETSPGSDASKYTITLKSALLTSGSVVHAIIGTLEAGYETPRDIPPERAIAVANFISMAAVCPTIRRQNSDDNTRILPLTEVLLPHVLKVITRNAMRIVGGNAARLCFGKNADGQYLYDVRAADSNPSKYCALKLQMDGLGDSALEARMPLVDPDASRGQPYDNLRSTHPEAWSVGIRAMAAFPMFVEPKQAVSQGVVYVFLKERAWFLDNEIRSVERFVAKAVDAIRKVLIVRQRMDGVGRLETFNRTAQSLVSDIKRTDALEWIVGGARNLLRADLVLIHEYDSKAKSFDNSWCTGRLRDEAELDNYKRAERRFSGRWMVDCGGNAVHVREWPQVGSSESGYTDAADAEESFICKEAIRSRMGINLSVATGAGAEIVGCMFVHYRHLRHPSENEKKVLEILSYAAGAAIRDKRYVEDIRFNLDFREKELAALRDVDKEIVSTKGDVGKIQELVLDRAMAITGATLGAFFEYEAWDNSLKPLFTKGYPVGLQVSSQQIDEGIVGFAAREGRPIVVSDVSSAEWKNMYLCDVSDTRSELAFPICDKEMPESPEVVAVINLEHPHPGFFRDEHAELLGMFAEQALIGMHYGQLLERNRRSIRALEALGVIAARSQSAAHDRDTIMRLFLTGVTAYEGLGFSRAMVFLKSEEGDALEGAMGIGELHEDKARLTWSTLEKERETCNDVLQRYLDCVATKAGPEEWASIVGALKSQRIPLEGYEGALAECLHRRQYRIVKHDEHDRFRETLAAMSRGADQGSAFICVPIAFRERVMGVMVADNRWLPSEEQLTFDERVLVTYANILAISLDNERLHTSAALSEVFNEIGHDFNRPITRLTSVIASLKRELHRAPHIENLFWNSLAGEHFEKLLEVRDDISRFTRDFQEFGKSISLRRETVELGAVVEELVADARYEFPLRIEYDDRPQKHLLELDCNLFARAFDAVLHNAVQALSKRNASEDPHISVESRVETDLGGCSFAVISIADNGPGVPQQRKQRIFQPFFTTRTNEGGSGLGLASARRYIEAHGGSLREVGKVGQGAVFVMRLPLISRAATIARGAIPPSEMEN